ncbi:MAG: heme ABC exporter ATP-binding protein CcmA [Candidatus Rokubacteria bacterium]|nr:heme ABC exporter ATP-binding protein CcmA [Candidatus Rokubacteria bacterium]MBI4593177.1 heme ABC exporter ATP-binding protein CcmA [Candidatus Rokubacteria bacterium]
MATDPLIHISGLRKTFGGRRVLGEVNLDVHPGEAVALLGANGAGKTTLLRILATLARPTRGHARVAGFDCVREAEQVRARVGLVAHGSWVYEDLSPLENLKFWATLAGLRPAPEALRLALGAVDLERVAHERVRTFSEGMKRRLSFARLFLTRPRVILLDEPFAGLDQGAGKWLERHLADFKAGGGGLLVTTHSFGRGLGLWDRIAVLAAGRITLDTPVGTLGADDVRRLYELHAEESA